MQVAAVTDPNLTEAGEPVESDGAAKPEKRNNNELETGAARSRKRQELSASLGSP